MGRFVEGEDRRQQTMLPACLEDYIAEENAVRVVDAFIDELDLIALGFERVQPAATGRPSYHPTTLLKIYLYGYLNRIQSSRRLERETARNIELMWLTGRLVPDFKTIADFRQSAFESLLTLSIDRRMAVFKQSRLNESIADRLAIGPNSGHVLRLGCVWPIRRSRSLCFKKSDPYNLPIPDPEMGAALFLRYPQGRVESRLAVRDGQSPRGMPSLHEVHVDRIAATTRALKNGPFRGIAHDVQRAAELIRNLRAAIEVDDGPDLMTSAKPKPKPF